MCKRYLPVLTAMAGLVACGEEPTKARFAVDQTRAANLESALKRSMALVETSELSDQQLRAAGRVAVAALPEEFSRHLTAWRTWDYGLVPELRPDARNAVYAVDCQLQIKALRDIGAIWTKALREAEETAGIAIEDRLTETGHQAVDVTAGGAHGQWLGINDRVTGFSFGCRG